jgi:hypothetical protein
MDGDINDINIVVSSKCSFGYLRFGDIQIDNDSKVPDKEHWVVGEVG